MPSHQIRPLALCVFHHEGRILVNEINDRVKNQTFGRPLGGGIEFGETSAQAIQREIREELGLEITNLHLVGTLENIFTHLGTPGHEIVQVYDGTFVDGSAYEKSCLPGRESDGAPFNAYWRGREHFSKNLPLYPDGLAELLVRNSLFKEQA
jgi:8-oxo-dGTP pyrophosphatase MutT (NUDIX family)